MKYLFQTATGNAFDFEEFSFDKVKIEDIAHSLSLLCRFNGHCDRFYSVSEHSYNIAISALNYLYAFKSKDDKMFTGEELNFLLWALLHDATEAYVSDMPKPVKVLMPNFNEMEDKVSKVIEERFNLKPLGDFYTDLLKKFDVCMLYHEACFLGMVDKQPHAWSPPNGWNELSPYVIEHSKKESTIEQSKSDYIWFYNKISNLVDSNAR